MVKLKAIKTDEKQSEYPNQIWILQRRQDGFIKTFGIFSKLPSKDEILSDYGQFPWTLKRTKPRFAVEWKITKEEVRPDDEKIDAPSGELVEKLSRRTKYLGVGLIGSFGIQALGFGLSHLRFSQIEDRIAKVETALRSLPVQGLYCTGCRTPIVSMLQEFCTGCATPIEWPKDDPSHSVKRDNRWSLP